MILILIRHAEAVAQEAFDGDDQRRPLTDEGRAACAAVAAGLARLYGNVDRVFTSSALRARETAAILAQGLGGPEIEESELLLPGAGSGKFGRLLARLKGADGCVAVVGHEPDLSRILGDLVSGGSLRVKLGKLSCAVVEIDKTPKARLRALLPRRTLCVAPGG